MYEGAMLDLVIDRLQKEAKMAEEYLRSQSSSSSSSSHSSHKSQETQQQTQEQKFTAIGKPSVPTPSALFGKTDEPKTFESHIQDLLGKAYASREVISKETDKAVEIKQKEEKKDLQSLILGGIGMIGKEIEERTKPIIETRENIKKTLWGIGEDVSKRVEGVLPPGIRGVTKESIAKELELGGKFVEKEGKEMLSAIGEKAESFYKTLTSPQTPSTIAKTAVEKYIQLEGALQQKTIEAVKTAQDSSKWFTSTPEEIKREQIQNVSGFRSTTPTITEKDFSKLAEAEKMSKTIGEFIPTSQERKLTESQEKLLKESPIHSLGLGLFGETYEVMLGRKSWEDLSRKETIEKAYEIEIPQDVYSKFFEGGKLRPDVQKISEGDKTTLIVKETETVIQPTERAHKLELTAEDYSMFFEGGKIRPDVQIKSEGEKIVLAQERESEGLVYQLEMPKDTFTKFFSSMGEFKSGVEKAEEGGKVILSVKEVENAPQTLEKMHKITLPTSSFSTFFEGDKLRQDVKISEKEGKVILTAVEAEEKRVETPFWEKFAMGGGFLGGMTSGAIGVPLFVKKAVTEGVVEAGKEAVVGSAMTIGAIPSKITSRNPILIGEAVGEITISGAMGKVGSKIAKTPGKISETIEFIGKEHVPIEKLTQPEILKGEVGFPYARKIEGMKYGEKAPAEKAVEMNIEMFYKDPSALATKLGREAREEGKAYGFHATPEKFDKEIIPRDAPARKWDVGGMYIAPDVSIHFLRIIQEKGSLGFSFEELIKNPIPTTKEMLKRTFGFDRPMIAGFKLEGVERVPPEYRTSLEKMKEFFSTGMEKGIAKPGYAYVEPKVEIGHTTGEAQTVIPPKGVWREAESSQYTKLHGRKILIKEYVPELEEGKPKAEIEAKSKLEDTKIVEKSKKELFTEKEISTSISERYQTYLYRDVSYDFSRLLAGSKELIKSEGIKSEDKIEYGKRSSVQPSYLGLQSSATSPIKSEMKASSKISEIESSSKDSLITSPIKSEIKSEIESSSKKDTQYTQTYYSEAYRILRNVDKKIGAGIVELPPEKIETEKLKPKLEKRLFKQELPATAEWFWAVKSEALTGKPARVVIDVGSKKMKELPKERLKFGLATSIKGYEGR